MAALDEIRLIGRLREGPRKGPFLFPGAPARGIFGAIWPKVRVWRAPAPAISRVVRGFLLSSAARTSSASRSRTTRRASKSAAKPAEDGYCPHCHLLVERRVGTDWPRDPLRCPHCRLLVGVGRGRPTPSAEPGARGSAAGVFAHEAKRSGGEGEASKSDVRKAIRQVAEDEGQRPERLLMVDYQQHVTDDDELPSLSDVFAAYGSWKRARRAAADAA
jgi:hypothetical protein